MADSPGTSLWIDPGLDLSVSSSSNRLHPRGKGSVNRLVGRIGTITLPTAITHRPCRVITLGIDALHRDGFRDLLFVAAASD